MEDVLEPPPQWLAADRSKAVILGWFFLNVIWSGCFESCFVFYFYSIYVICIGSITSVGEERELMCLHLFTCNHVVSVRRGFLFLLVLGMDCVILLWHSYGLQYK